MCFVEQKTFSVILRIFLTNAPPLWFPLYFGLQKCWRWQFLHTIVEEYGQIRFKGYYNLFCGTENIFCDIRYFPHKCATFVVPFVSWFTKMLTLKIFSQNRWWVWLKCACRFKGCYNCIVEQKTFSVILRIFLTNAPPLWFPLYFGLQKCWRWQFLLKIVEEYG